MTLSPAGIAANGDIREGLSLAHLFMSRLDTPLRRITVEKRGFEVLNRTLEINAASNQRELTSVPLIG